MSESQARDRSSVACPANQRPGFLSLGPLRGGREQQTPCFLFSRPCSKPFANRCSLDPPLMHVVSTVTTPISGGCTERLRHLPVITQLGKGGVGIWSPGCCPLGCAVSQATSPGADVPNARAFHLPVHLCGLLSGVQAGGTNLQVYREGV